MNISEINCMNFEEAEKATRAIAKALRQIALKSVQKREKQEVEKALLTPVDKRKRAHDDFHKFVRSL